MILIVDASIVVKLAVLEDGHREALALLGDESDTIIAPEWMPLEVASALWRKWRAREIGASQAEQAMTHVLDSFQNLVAGSALAYDALRLATELDHPVYDCAYLACALQAKGVLVTTDRRLVAAAVGAGHAALIHPAVLAP